jgi:Glycoside Hydrolase Family 113
MAFSLKLKGFNYTSYYNGAYENADSLISLAGTGANTVALNIEYGIDANNSTVYTDSNYTDSLAVLGKTIKEASADGLSVMVRPLIDFLKPALIGSYSVGDWRSYYNPSNPAAFFASYKTMIVDEATVAQANGAASVCIGTEFDQLTGPAYLSYWTDIISAVRAVFSGKLTYSADWNSAASPWKGQHGLPAGTGDLATQVSFWSQLARWVRGTDRTGAAARRGLPLHRGWRDTTCCVARGSRRGVDRIARGDGDDALAVDTHLGAVSQSILMPPRTTDWGRPRVRWPAVEMPGLAAPGFFEQKRCLSAKNTVVSWFVAVKEPTWQTLQP